MEEAHKQVFDLVPVQFVAAQHSAAQSHSTLVLMIRKGNKKRQRSDVRETLLLIITAAETLKLQRDKTSQKTSI